MRRRTALIMACIMAAGSMASACGRSQSGAAAEETAVAAGAEAGAEKEAVLEETVLEETAAEDETEAGEGGAASEETETRTVVGADGKEVVIPYQVTRVAPSIGAFAQVTEMLSKGKMVATSTAQISDYFKEIFPDYAESNPNNYDTGSMEDLIASGAQVVYGPNFSDEQIGQMAQAGIAYVSVSNLSDSAGMMDSYRLIGEILGEEEAEIAEEFCTYWQGSIDDCQERTKELTDEERVKVLRLSVSGGAYTTVNNTDIFTSIVAEAGGINVAAEYQSNGGGQGAAGQGSGGQAAGGRAAGGPNSGLSLDAEQIIAWDPDVIIAMNQDGVEAILSDPALASVKAVRDGKVYNTPQGIYLWGVRSGENAMMTPWLGTILYPELFADVDMEQVVIDFFHQWYGAEIDAAAAQMILEGK